MYDTFKELFHPVIAEYHKVDVATLVSVHDLGDAANLADLPQNYQDQIVSTRVRVGRTVKGFPMASKLTREVLLSSLIVTMYYMLFNSIIKRYRPVLRWKIELRRPLLN